MASKYKKCPRCELNYILLDEELCQVCKAELKLAPSEYEDDMELCTICGKNLITVDQVMCDDCAKRRNLDDVVDEGEEVEEEESSVADWDNNSQASPKEALDKVLAGTHNGEVILLHPTSATNAEILDDLIKEWKSMGFRFGTLDELTK